MRVAVTGGLGFIGSCIVEKLLKHGHSVLVIDIRTGKAPEGAEVRLADVTNFDQMVQLLDDIDVIYHLANTTLSIARRQPRLTVDLDILGTTNVLEACVINDVEKIIYASSFYVYDGLPCNLQVDENWHSDIFKTEMFGVAKLVCERLILEYNRLYGLRYVILRYGSVYGLGDRCTSVIFEFVKAGIRGDPLVIWGSGERKNQYTYIEDIAEGSVRALSFENEIFNLISPEYVRIRQVAKLLSEKYGFKVTYDLSKQEGPFMPYISPKKAVDKLRSNPATLKEGIEKLILGINLNRER